MTEGKEGGTWLGMVAKDGRFAVLTNIQQASADVKPDSKSRG